MQNLVPDLRLRRWKETTIGEYEMDCFKSAANEANLVKSRLRVSFFGFCESKHTKIKKTTVWKHASYLIRFSQVTTTPRLFTYTLQRCPCSRRKTRPHRAASRLPPSPRLLKSCPRVARAVSTIAKVFPRRKSRSARRVSCHCSCRKSNPFWRVDKEINFVTNSPYQSPAHGQSAM